MSLTVRSVCQKFLAWCKVVMRPSTYDAYEHQLKKFMRHVKRKHVEKACPLDLSTWAKTWHEAQAVIRCFNWAVTEAKLIASNPYTPCRLPVRGLRRRIMNTAAMQKLMRRARRAPRLFLLALRETAARPQEIRNAQFEQLVAENPDTPLPQALREGSALIVQPKFKDCERRKDQSTPRVLLVTRRLGRAILRIANRRGIWSGPIFTNTRQLSWTKNAVRCLFRRLRKAVGFIADADGENVVAYTFRHSMATIAGVKDGRMRIIADWLGHVDPRTTQRYLHHNVQQLRDATAAFTSDRRRVR